METLRGILLPYGELFNPILDFQKKMKKIVPVSDLPVMKNYCKSCPFKPNDKGYWQNMELANEVINRTLFKGQQICHGTEGDKRQPKNRCKGAYEHNLEIYKRLGWSKLLK